jgi:hypothetical protein
MIAALALIHAASLPIVRPNQDAPAAAAKTWTQEGLERVSGEIQADIETLRGMKFTRPVKVKVTDKKGFLDYARKREEKTETPERLARDETIAKMLGLIPADMDLRAATEKLLESQVGGFYDPGSDTFYLMDSFGGDLARIILAHELTHALDDQSYGLDTTLEKLHEQTDAEFAFRAVVEGSGTAAMNQWTVQHLKNLDTKALLESQDIDMKGLEDAPPFIWKPLIATYMRGEGFLVRVPGMNIAMKAAKTEDIRQAFEHPPCSSEQILHPEKYWDSAKLDPPRKVEFDVSKLPEGWKVLGEDTLGELYLALVTSPPQKRKGLDVKNPLALLNTDYTNKAAEGWGGDGALLLGQGDARVLWLVTAWDTPEDAQEFADATKSALTGGVEATGAQAERPFHYWIGDPGETDEVVAAAYAGIAERDLPKPAWKIASKSEGWTEERGGSRR